MSYVLMGGFREPPWTPRSRHKMGDQVSNTKELGKVLTLEYLYPLEIAAKILLDVIVHAHT
jgi:NADH-quinone oxidoreductase subunit J